MPITSWTIYGNHPRIHCRDTDKTGGLNIQGMSNTANQWQSVWNTYIIGYADSAVAKTDAALAAESDLDAKLWTLGLAGWIDNVTSYHNRLLGTALYLANNSSLWDGWNNRREQVMGLAYAYDFLRTGVVTFSDANRKTIGDALFNMCNQTYNETTSDFEDGHEAGNMMAQAIAAIALAGESGSGFNYVTEASDLLATCFGYWFGSAPGLNNHIESVRYFQGDGGSGKGTWYQALDGLHTMWMLNAITNGFSAIEEDGVAYDPFTSETWVAKVGEWWVRMFCRGDLDYITLGDCSRTYTNPFLQDEARRTLAVLIRRGGTWRKSVRWLRDTLNAKSATSPHSLTNYQLGFDVALYDPNDANNASLPPASASPALPKYRLFDPPGEFVFDSTLDFVQGCKISISSQEFAPTNHQHLSCGGIQIWVKNDCVLARTGKYSTSDTAADFGGTHHRNWHQQSIAHSGTLLIDEPGLTHKARNVAGSNVDYPTGLGGQLWKEYDPGTGVIYDPKTTTNRRNQDSKLAWRRCGTDAAGTDRFKVIAAVPGIYTFIHADTTYSYLKRSADYGTNAQRVTRADFKIMIIESVAPWPVIFRVARGISRLSTYVKRDHWHFHRQPSVAIVGDEWRTIGVGEKGIGKVEIRHYNVPGFGATVVQRGTPNSAGYGATQFSYGNNNYAPTLAVNPRQLPDIGQYRVEISPTVARTNDWFVTALFPSLATETPPNYTWIDETDWFGMDFGGSQFRISKQQVLSQVTGADTTPPGAPTGVAANGGGGSGTIDVSWVLNTDTDMASYAVDYRVKV